jgi:CBS domain containing-hemolysin-like protein
VTVEDIMEEIVGEIEDEYDRENHEERIKQLSPTRVEVDARVHVYEINELMDVDLPEDEDFDTMGGFVMARCARVPAPGETVAHEGLRIKTLQSDERAVRRLLLELEEPGARDEGG